MQPYRVFVVDDSAFMRKIVSDLIQQDPFFTVLGTASNGREAIAQIAELQPDLVTMDVEMPVMNGLEALKIIMEKHPMPVIMLSGINEQGMHETIMALELGAFDFIRKPSVTISSLDILEMGEVLREQMRTAMQMQESRKERELARKRMETMPLPPPLPEPLPEPMLPPTGLSSSSLLSGLPDMKAVEEIASTNVVEEKPEPSFPVFDKEPHVSEQPQPYVSEQPQPYVSEEVQSAPHMSEPFQPSVNEQIIRPVSEQPLRPVSEQPLRPIIEQPLFPVGEQLLRPMGEPILRPMNEQQQSNVSEKQQTANNDQLTRSISEQLLRPISEQPLRPIIEQPLRLVNEQSIRPMFDQPERPLNDPAIRPLVEQGPALIPTPFVFPQFPPSHTETGDSFAKQTELDKSFTEKLTTNSSIPTQLDDPVIDSGADYSDIVAIGCSTGGPKALKVLLEKIPADFAAPIMIVQHMPPNFTKSLAQRLNSITSLKVVEAEDGMELSKGTVYIAPGGFHMNIVPEAGKGYVISLNTEELCNGHRPSVDVMYESLLPLKLLRRHIILLTGMGSDGAKMMKRLYDSGVKSTFAESEDTCVVYGMPRSAVEMNCVNHVLPIHDIAGKLLQVVK